MDRSTHRRSGQLVRASATIFSVLLGVSLLVPLPALAAPLLAVDPDSGLAGSDTAVVGRGFVDLGRYRIMWDGTSQKLADVQANSSGVLPGRGDHPGRRGPGRPHHPGLSVHRLPARQAGRRGVRGPCPADPETDGEADAGPTARPTRPPCRARQSRPPSRPLPRPPPRPCRRSRRASPTPRSRPRPSRRPRRHSPSWSSHPRRRRRAAWPHRPARSPTST